MSKQQYIRPSQRALHQQTLTALLLVQFVTVIPFMRDLPQWLVLVFALVVGWRLRVMRGRMVKPPLLVLLAAVALGVVGLFASGLQSYSLDSAVGFCLLGYLLKSLEVLRQRDAVFQVYLGYFLAGVYLLYHSGPLDALLAVFIVVVNTFALYTATAGHHVKWSFGVKQSVVVVLGAVPIMILGYLFFPRLPPLWSIPNDQRGAVTGMTDEITPGSVADLARSQEPAFRVAFEGELPPRSEWYWRGNTLSVFDGQTWRSAYSARRGMISATGNQTLPRAMGGGYEYTVVMDASQQNWLYFMDWPTQANVAGAMVLPDARLALREPLKQATRYSAVSSQTVAWTPLSEFERQRMLQLPAQGNERLREWSLALYSQADNDTQFVQLLAEHIRNNDYYYTLRPPLFLGENSLSDFWFEGRRGFCSHYASATAFMLRAVGIPARLVGGYQGGVYNEAGGFVQVRQMEAHVWVEAWLDGAWRRFDPTFSVAPNRIEQTLDDLFEGDQVDELPALARLRGSIGALSRLTMWWDLVEYRWQIAVLDYQSDSAIGWFERNFGELTPLKAAVSFMVFMGVLALGFALYLGVFRLPTRVQEPYRTMAKLEKMFGMRKPGETLTQYFERIRQQNHNQPRLDELHSIVERTMYDDTPPDVQRMKQIIKEMHPRYQQ